MLLLSAPDGFRCPETSRIIELGDYPYEVVRKCREPDSKLTRVETRTHRDRIVRYYRGVAREEEVERKVEIVIEEWLFDFGPSRFMRHLKFENDHLVRIVEGEYGTK